MVYMKKATPSKNNQQQFKKGKKAVQVKQEEDNDFDMDGSDDDVDSDEAPQLQRTPANKGMKGRQSLSEKKVSFSIPGKNSPAVKTPKKDNSILAKKQPTPASKGRTSMQEFKGIKGKQAQAQDDDDDDDEEDDDFEIDEDEEDDDLDLDIDEGDDDEEEEDDDDDDDDDEEDDDDDEEEEEDDKASIQKKLSLLKQNNAQQNKQKTPVKGNDKAKNAESPVKGQTPKKEKADVKVPQQITDEVERRRQRDAKMLYIGGLPNDVKEDELKSLSTDIVDITLPLGNRKNPTKTVFAFLAFNSEAKAESNYKALQSKKFRGQPLTVDFVGAKSKNMKAADETNLKFNLKKLFVAGIPVEATIDQLAKFFKAAFQITFNRSPVFRTAVISFDTEEDAKEAHEANKEIVLSGHKLPVLYSRQAGQKDSRKRKNRNKKPNKNSTNNHGENPAKKMKFSKPE